MKTLSVKNHLCSILQRPKREWLCSLLLLVTIPVMAAEGIGFTIASYVLERQCHHQLVTSKQWQTISLWLPAAQKTQLTQEVCGCLAQKISQHLTVQEILKLIAANERHQRIKSLSRSSMIACAQEAWLHK